MNQRHMPAIEGVLRQIEGRVKEWLAAEREKLVAKQRRTVFVAHSGEMSRTLEAFATGKARLARVLPGCEEAGLKGSWLIFERLA